MPELQTRAINAKDFFGVAAPKDKIAFLLQYAVLAPSTHNSQPWQFRLGDDYCDILYDDSHPIVYADPQGRDLYVSFGCLIENLAIAARYFKVFKGIEYHFQLPAVARMRFDFSRIGDTDESVRPLLDAILRRVNARGLFEKDRIDEQSQAIFEKIETPQTLHKEFLSRTEDIMTIAELTRQGLRVAYDDPRFRREMSEWFNHGLSKKPTGIPSYSLRMPLLVSFIFSWLVRHFNIGKRLGFLNYISINSAPAALVVTADENTPRNWVETGRLAERFVLQANVCGYKTSFFTAAIEMGEIYKDVQKMLGTLAIPQFIIMYGKLNYEQKPNLRHSARNKIIA